MMIKKIGAHGYSLGGSVASHIALKKQLDFLIADRTFSSVSDIASKGYTFSIKIFKRISKIIRVLFNMLKDWN